MTKKYDNLREQHVQNWVPRDYTVPYLSAWKPLPLIKTKKLITKPNPFEPQTFDDFVGQEFAKGILKIIVDSANKEKRLIPNILMTGAYGHGKTTLAKLVIQRHCKRIQLVDGSIAATIIIPSTDTVYIVDEAHNIPPQLADTYNILIDAGQLRMVACTNKPGMLPAPFRSRFRSIYLGDYTLKNIGTILKNAAKRSKIKISEKAIIALAIRSKLNPRYALTLLDFMREIAVLEATNKPEITEEAVLGGALRLNIDTLGLTELDRKYLSLLRTDNPVGLSYISSVLSVDVDTIQNEIEPYLMHLGLVERTPRGRLLIPSTTDQILLATTWKKPYEV